jgi:hypothetical protein
LIAVGSVEGPYAAVPAGERGDFLADLLGYVGATPKVVEVATSRAPSVFVTSVSTD